MSFRSMGFFPPKSPTGLMIQIRKFFRYKFEFGKIFKLIILTKPRCGMKQFSSVKCQVLLLIDFGFNCSLMLYFCRYCLLKSFSKLLKRKNPSPCSDFICLTCQVCEMKLCSFSECAIGNCASFPSTRNETVHFSLKPGMKLCIFPQYLE